MTADDRLLVFHFAEDDDTSGFFPQLAKRHDRARFRMAFGTLKPMAPWLRDYMNTQGVEPFSAEGRTRSAYPSAALRLRSYLRARRPAIFHAHLFDPAVVGLPTAAASGNSRRVLTRHHSDYHTRIRRPLHVALDRMCTGLSHRVIAVSRHTKDHLVAVEGASPEKVVAIPNGIDFDRLAITSRRSVEEFRAELGVASCPLLLIVARLHPEKGYEHLFRALRMVRSQADPPPVLLVAGTGPLRESYERLAAEAGVADLVRFLGFRRDIADLIRTADCVVLPSVAESFGLAAVESLYLGTPVIASAVGGLPEIVRDQVDGLLVPPGDPQALATALVRFLADAGLRARLRGAGTARVEAEFRFEDMVRRYEAVYEELLAVA